MRGPSGELERALTDAGDTRAAAEVLTGIRDSSQAPDILAEVLANEERLAWVADRSYRHPNGFDRIVLHGGIDAQCTVRLHIWWPEEPAGVEQIHNHAWDFSSLLLAGSLRFELFQPGGDIAKLHFRTGPPRAGGGYRMRALGQTQVSRVLDAQLPTSAVYTLDHRALHRVARAGTEPTATLIVHGPFLRQESDILADAPLDEHEEQHVRAFDVGELRGKLERLIATIDG